jgi:small subunit ribosomal protein S6
MRNRRYETVFILPPDLEEGRRKEILDRLDGVVEKGGGIRVKREDWGVRRLAYAVNRNPKGHYYLLDYVGSAQIVAELERHMRMLENVLRFLTVKTDDRADPEAAEKEQAEERVKEEAREAERRESALREEERKEAALREEAQKKAALEEEAASQEASEADEPAPSEEPLAEEEEVVDAVSPDTGDQEEAGEEAVDAVSPDTGDQEEAEEEPGDETGPAVEEEGEEEKREG